MSKKRSYDDALSALEDILSDKEKAIDAREEKLRKVEEKCNVREEKLQKAEEKFKVDRSAVNGTTGPSDVLHLNIGGTKATVLRRTLTSVPGSMLASKFSGRWDDSLAKDENGNFFIDQEFSIFQPMLNYLRNNANVAEKCPLISPGYYGGAKFGATGNKNEFYRMVEHYGLTNAIYPTNLAIHTGQKDSVEIIGAKKVNAREWATFQLANVGHGRIVRAYEVKLGNVQRIQIGWKYKSEEELTITNGNNLGVGDVSYTHALDLTKSKYLAAGEGTAIDGLKQVKGTIVRSEDFGRLWYVNGELLDTPQEAWTEFKTDYKDPSRGYRYTYRETVCPLISLKGEMEIIFVELATL